MGSTNTYNPPQTPPFEKEGLVVGLLAYLTGGEDVAIGGHISELQYSLYLIDVMNCEV